MRRALAPALALTASALVALAPGSAVASITLGPTVAPRGPGRVTLVWESAEATPLVVRGPDGATRQFAATDARNGVQRVDVDGLTPGVEYRYTVGARTGRFIAPPDRDQAVRFAVFGDARTGDAVHQAVVARVAALRPDFVLATGDVVPDGDAREGWRNFFRIEAPLMGTTPFVTARGNHDGHESLFEQFITVRSDTPGAAPTYGSMDLGAVHVVVVDTESALGPGSAQHAFLARDLEANRGRPMVALLHKPLFSTGRHGGTPEVHAALGPLFQRSGVDLVFQGHDHHYERTTAINGVTYVVTGGAGAPLFGASGGTWTAVKESVNHYLVVDASATSLRVTARRIDDSVLDSFEIDPRRNDHREFAAARAALPAPGGGGCAMLLFGRERGVSGGGGGLSARADVTGAFGSFGPLLGLAVVRGAKRRRRR